VAKTVDGVTTGYVLDPAAGLTQVLQETTGGQTASYLYGHDLLPQYDSGTWAYHVNDGLGSVRQLVDAAGQVVQGYSFIPFGVPLGESGGEPDGFTGEQWDASTGLVFLRARYYQPGTGRFVSKDSWEGNLRQPQTLNGFSYVENNAVNRADPTGEITRTEAPRAEQIINELRKNYDIYVEKDFLALSWEDVGCVYPLPPPPAFPSGNDPWWYPGAWELSELDTVKRGVERLAGEFLSPAEFRRIVGGARIDRCRGQSHWKQLASRQLWKVKPWAFTAGRSVTIFATPDEALIAHELGHVWDGMPPRITPLIKAFKGNELPWDLGMERGWEYWPATVEAWVYERQLRFSSRPRHREFAEAAFLGIYLLPEGVFEGFPSTPFVLP
jgi:RHS repeat-associated protein